MSTKNKGDILAAQIDAIAKKYIIGSPREEIVAALADYHRPWPLGRSVNGFTLGEGQEWHRNDWTEDMLPEGWRPLIKGEQVEDADQRFHSEYGLQTFPIKTEYGRMAEYVIAGQEHMHLRTRRPLPTVAKLVPLGPEDVPPGSVFKRIEYANHAMWIAPIAVLTSCIEFHDSVKCYQVSFAELQDRWLISRDGGKTWQKCQKEGK